MTDTDSTQHTPAEHRHLAGEILNRATTVNPVSPLYQNLVLTALTRAMLEIGAHLDALLTRLEPPKLPGLPPGWLLDAEQSQGGGHKWRYVLTPPGELESQIVSQYRWEEAATAIAEGIRHAAVDWSARTAASRNAGSNGGNPDE